MDKIRWGILGCGNIAGSFAKGLQAIPDAELVACASRTQAKADAFGDKFTVARRHTSYEALAADPGVDAIYVATPHPMHKENTIMCLNAGKPVLCEKPFTINAKELEEVVETARRKKVFLMEAMWSRFLPVQVKVRELLASKAIGEVRMVHADFGFRAGVNPTGRLFDLKLGGGGLLDVGIYAISFTWMVMQKAPTRISAFATIGETGADEQAAWILGYDRGELATGYTAIRTNTPHEGTILGTEGRIRVHSPFWRGTKLQVVAGGKTEELDCPYVGNGYNCQAVEVMNCLRAGKLESSIMPHEESLRIMRTLDAIRAQWGLKYPME